jgi:hypothetical protein
VVFQIPLFGIPKMKTDFVNMNEYQHLMPYYSRISTFDRSSDVFLSTCTKPPHPQKSSSPRTVKQKTSRKNSLKVIESTISILCGLNHLLFGICIDNCRNCEPSSVLADRPAAALQRNTLPDFMYFPFSSNGRYSSFIKLINIPNVIIHN